LSQLGGTLPEFETDPERVIDLLAAVGSPPRTSPQDRDAIKAWVDGNADRDKARAVYDSLAQLRVGEGWIWASDHDLIKRVKFPPIVTLDTSKTPKAGDGPLVAPVLAEADIEKLKGRFTQIEGQQTGRATPKPASTKRTKAPVVLRARKAAPPQKTHQAHAARSRRRRYRPRPHERQLTQNQLVERLHTYQGNIARLEHGRAQATVRTLKRIAIATGHRLVIDFRK
jgi:hypothetical protein